MFTYLQGSFRWQEITKLLYVYIFITMTHVMKQIGAYLMCQFDLLNFNIIYPDDDDLTTKFLLKVTSIQAFKHNISITCKYEP